MINQLISSLVAFLILTIISTACATTLVGKVVRVLDGDTFEILSPNNTTTRVRLSEIDCPEKGGQPYGQKAKQFAINLVARKNVTVEVVTTDRYSRTIGEVFLSSGESINRLLVAEGYAWWYSKYSKDNSLRDLERLARSQKKGLWHDDKPIPPWQWRKNRKR